MLVAGNVVGGVGDSFILMQLTNRSTEVDMDRTEKLQQYMA